MILSLVILIQYCCVTDTQTHDDGIYHTNLLSSGNTMHTELRIMDVTIKVHYRNRKSHISAKCQ